MDNILQFLGTFASIFSIPLAIIFYFKTSDARQNKIRLEIIRSLSYRIGEGKLLDKVEVSAVFNSKVREHNIRKPLFSEATILEDIIADAISNPFLTSDQKTSIIKNVGDALETYGLIENEVKNSNETHVISEYTENQLIINDTKRKRYIITTSYTLIAVLLSFAVTIMPLFFEGNYTIFFENIQFPIEVIISFLVATLTSVIAYTISAIMIKTKKK